MGAVITIQTAYNANSPFFPAFLTGIAARDSIILEFSSTIVALILAGKVGSNISSELGTMRITEQIDALEIMGVNSASYLVLPKIIAALIFIPFLTIISIIVGIVGGWVAGFTSGAVASGDFIQGLQFYFRPFYVKYSLIKTFLFSFVLTSIPAYHGYYVTQGSLEVGRAGTLAVVYSSIVILFINVVLTQLLLT
jgi:phospholipid/cholesterol/gamma-HCH transport system permease protein